MIGFGMIIPLIPFYAISLGASPSSIGILIASFSLMQVLFSPILGRISDHIGRRPVLLLSILTSLVSFILFTLADSFIILLLSRLVAGLATEAAVAQAYIADSTTKAERAKGMGKIGAALGIGFILGPAMSGFLSPYGFWAPGVAAVILSLVNFLFVLVFLPESIPKEPVSKEQVSLQNEGQVYLRRLIYAISQPLTGAVYIIYFIVTFAFSTIPVIVPLLVEEFYNFSAVEMSYLFMYIGVLQVLLQAGGIGKIMQKISEESLIIIGPLLMLGGIFVMPLTRSLIVFLGTLSLLSAGVALTNTIVPSFLSKRTPLDRQGQVLGLTQSVSSLARVPGPVVSGVIYDLGGTGMPFFVSAIILFLPVVLACKVFQKCQRSK
jgi:MFS family permease